MSSFIQVTQAPLNEEDVIFGYTGKDPKITWIVDHVTDMTAINIIKSSVQNRIYQICSYLSTCILLIFFPIWYAIGLFLLTACFELIVLIKAKLVIKSLRGEMKQLRIKLLNSDT